METFNQKKQIQIPILAFEKFGNVSLEQEAKVQEICEQVIDSLAEEWQTKEPISVQVWIMSDEKFREGAKEDDPASWKYCFLMHDPKDKRVYINIAIFSVLQDEAASMIKHELAHVVINGIIGDQKYKISYLKSYPFHEGFAGFENATKLLVEKIKKENIESIPDPLSIDSMEKLKQLGGDTNKEPFNQQLGYLVIFSFAEFFKEKYGREKIIEIYEKLSDEISFADSYKQVCSENLDDVVSEWKLSIKNLL